MSQGRVTAVANSPIFWGSKVINICLSFALSDVYLFMAVCLIFKEWHQDPGPFTPMMPAASIVASKITRKEDGDGAGKVQAMFPPVL